MCPRTLWSILPLDNSHKIAGLSQDAVTSWVSSPDSRHSRNIAHRAAVAITVFDSTVEVGQAEAAYFDADAAQATPEEMDTALQSLNSRLPRDKRPSGDDLQPRGPLVLYRADLRYSYVLVRGGDPDLGNAVDRTVEV